MNNERRKSIQKAMELLDEAKALLEEARDEEQEYYDNMPETLQSGEKGDKAQSAVSCLDDAISVLEDLNLEDALA
jgi:galactokinase